VPKRGDRRIIVAAVLAVFVIVFFVIVGLAQGIGHPSPSSDEVAVVEDAPDGHITVDQFNTALEQTALGQGLQQVPKTSDPQYATLRDTAMANLITSRWIEGEAADRGITASDTDIQNWIKQNIGGPSQFKKAAKQAGFSEAEARDQARVIVLSQQLQKEVIPTQAPSVSDDLVKQFYDANKSQFTQPETRDVRQIVNKDKSKVEQAKTILEKNDSDATWKKVASKYSTDKATQSNGGLRQGVAQGQSEPALDQQIFSDSVTTNQLIGPFQGQNGWYLIEVEKVTPQSVTPLSKLASQIKQQLAQGEQQQIASDAQKSITDKWTSRTFCATGYVVQQCANFTPPAAATPGAPPVVSSAAVNPAQTTVFPGQAPQALSQGPQFPAPKQQPAVLGPGGAPTLPPGAAPPAGGTAVPPGG
jgi:parvulin-like peptidyl-prolyl cis-trans isomerase-like protein/SurA-like protein